MFNLLPDQPPGLTIEEAVATITLRRYTQHNRIAPEDCHTIRRHLDAVLAASGVRVIVITGTGKKTFSSGYTLGAIKDELDSGFEDMLDQVEHFPLPVICALNGSVYGGATDLALCCDFRIGVTGSRLLMPASRIGLHYYPGGIRRYVTTLGLASAKKLFLTGQAINDQEMLRIGFLHELVAPDGLATAVDAYVDGVLACEPNVLANMKADLMATAHGTASESVLRQHYNDSLKSPALAARLDALEKRGSK